MVGQGETALRPDRGASHLAVSQIIRPYWWRAPQARRDGYIHALRSMRPRPRPSLGNSCWHMRTSCRRKNFSRKSIPTRFLLAHGAGRCQGYHVMLCGLSVLHLTDSSPCASASEHPHHLVVCRMWAGHSRTIQASARGLHTPTHGRRYVFKME
jgi:hypothetical protein